MNDGYGGYGGPRRGRGGEDGGWRFGNWGQRSGLRGGERGGWDRGAGPRPGRPPYDRGYGRRGPGRWSGMESNRARGVYGSDYRAGGSSPGEHGGYRGAGWNRGGGMNPGRRGPGR